jgi:hypothetical protein
MHYLNGASARTSENENKMRENLSSRNLKWRFHCNYQPQFHNLLQKNKTNYISQTWGIKIGSAFITKLSVRIWHLVVKTYQHKFYQLSDHHWYISRCNLQSMQIWLYLNDIAWSCKELFGTKHQFSNRSISRRLSVSINMMIAVFCTECVNIKLPCTWAPSLEGIQKDSPF